MSTNSNHTPLSPNGPEEAEAAKDLAAPGEPRRYGSWFELFWDNAAERQEFIYYGGVVLVVAVAGLLLSGMLLHFGETGVRVGTLAMLLLLFSLATILALAVLYGVFLRNFMRNWRRQVLGGIFAVDSPRDLLGNAPLAVHLRADVPDPMSAAAFLWYSVGGQTPFEEFVERWVVYTSEDLLNQTITIQGTPLAVICQSTESRHFQRVIFTDGLYRFDGTPITLFGVIPLFPDSSIYREYRDLKEVLLGLPVEPRELQQMLVPHTATKDHGRFTIHPELLGVITRDMSATLTSLDLSVVREKFRQFQKVCDMQQLLSQPRQLQSQVLEYLESLPNFVRAHHGMQALAACLEKTPERSLKLLLDQFGYSRKKDAYERFVRSTVRLFRLFLLLEAQSPTLSSQDRISVALLRNHFREIPWATEVLTVGPPRALQAQLNLANVVPDQPYLFFMREFDAEDDMGQSPYQRSVETALKEMGFHTFELCFINT
ncbi:hypothetical protein [Desulfurispira natronophila]|uniref:Uncharacterized protein n=1 Tax=Desulfurispira natronophila TaxID=682562 RepID=A0A7W7Y684_9BACT|nr:hypothetical protein [Desulfurispira natronophila]MBB5022819.1 hypothetical protein [Desulfurispira natronophila]